MYNQLGCALMPTMRRKRLDPDLQRILDEESLPPTLPGFGGVASAADREMAAILRDIREDHGD